MVLAAAQLHCCSVLLLWLLFMLLLSCSKLLNDQNTVPPSCSFASTGMPGMSACNLFRAAPTTPGTSLMSSSVGFCRSKQTEASSAGHGLPGMTSTLVVRLPALSQRDHFSGCYPSNISASSGLLHTPGDTQHMCRVSQSLPGIASVRCLLLASGASTAALGWQPATKT